VGKMMEKDAVPFCPPKLQLVPIDPAVWNEIHRRFILRDGEPQFRHATTWLKIELRSRESIAGPCIWLLFAALVPELLPRASASWRGNLHTPTLEPAAHTWMSRRQLHPARRKQNSDLSRHRRKILLKRSWVSQFIDDRVQLVSGIIVSWHHKRPWPHRIWQRAAGV